MAEAPAKRNFLYYLTTVNHKDIGMMYLMQALTFLFVGGFMAWIIRAELAQPGLQFVDGQTFNQMTAMHASVMIFFVIIPAFAGFANYFMPIMIGSPDMAFPRLNNWSFWIMPFSAMLAVGSLFVPGGAIAAGWTAYPPLSNALYSPGAGIDMWILAVHLAGASSILGALNMIVTMLNMRAPGMTLFKMPMFPWAVMVTAWLQLVATPVLAGAITMLLTDRNFGTAFFNPAGGGDPVLFQHIFWFYSHPAVYIMILPGFGIVSEVISTMSRKKLFGYTSMVWALIAIALLGQVVWAHHMYTVGMDVKAQAMFMFMTMLIAVPTGIKIFNWLATMWGGSIEFTTAMKFSVGFLILFTIGGLSGVVLASAPVDYMMHDTYYVVAHFHYTMAAGALFSIMAGVYYWFPKMYGRMLSEKIGFFHFWLTFIGMNVTFFPQHFLGMMGMPRRIADYNPIYADLNFLSSMGAFIFGSAQLLLVINVILTMRKPQNAGDNPWGGHTLEWTVSSPPPEHNFHKIPVVS
ncbi:MAG: cytochrome c oxidase subunit I [Alphaproteobacteria bacterium]|nr:cytochrome c oxidase subunit I [Alphaproteobacteria bacterium]MDD9919874.1 cytochrome c oxidase subunit I [Alphaproteobacteria bacterium]